MGIRLGPSQGFTIFCAFLIALAYRISIESKISNVNAKAKDRVLALHAIMRLNETMETTSTIDQTTESVLHSEALRVQSLPACTTGIFRRELHAQNQFPETGSWIGANDSAHFKLDFCDFTPYKIEWCVRKNNITFILIVGDSQGRFYYQALLSHFRNSSENVECSKMRGEKITGAPRSRPEVSYFSRGNPELAKLIDVQTRGCRTCHNEVYECSFKSKAQGNHTVLLEFSTFFSLNDTSITINAPENKSVPNVPLARNYAEFLFKVYLLDKYPDLMLFFPPFNHEKQHYLADEVQRRLKELLRVLKTYKPHHTQVLWTTTPAEVENKRADPFWVNKTFQGMLANEKIVTFNRVMAQTLKPLLLDPDSNHFGFHNLYNMSFTKSHWSVDGVHYIPKWYDEVMYNVMSTLCHSKPNKF